MRHYDGLDFFHVYTAHAKHVVHVPIGHGEEVHEYLRQQGIESVVAGVTQASYDRLELARDVSASTVQALLDDLS